MNLNRSCFLPAFCLAGSFFMQSTTAKAAFIVQSNFEGLTPGPLANQGGWKLASDSVNNSTVALDPTDSANQVGFMTAPASSSRQQDTIYLTLANPIPDNTTATLFFRLYAPATAATRTSIINLSNRSSPISQPFRDSQVQFQLGGGNPGAANTLFTTSSDGTIVSSQALGTISNDTWTNYWLVIDTASDKTTFYSSIGNNAATLLGASAGYNFRIPANSPLLTLPVSSARGVAGSFYMDDIYVDNTGINLVNPVPEPSVVGLIIVAGLALVRRSRRN